MFDLEEAITAWRQRMLVAGIKTPVPLDELESHLRDDVEQQLRSGSDTRQAFETAVQRMGRAGEIKIEFQTALSSITNPDEVMKQHIRNFLVVIALLAIGVAFILPAVAQWRTQGALTGVQMALLLLGIACGAWGLWWGGASMMACVRKDKA